MLSARYKNDGRETFPLNSLQLALRDSINAKVTNGTYKFETTTCAVCGGTNEEQLAEKDRYGLYLPVVICRDCGLIYTNPRMDQASFANFYDNEYRGLYHGSKHPMAELFQGGLQRGKRIARYLIDNGVELTGKCVLEVGCGAGGILAHFRDEFNCDVYGCDFGSEGIEFGRSKHGLDLEVGNLRSVSYSQKPDLVIYSHVLEHVLSIENECMAISERLNESGILYVEVPSVKWIQHGKYQWDFLRLLQNAHTYHFTLTTLQNVMGKSGFGFVSGNETAQAIFSKADSEQETPVVSDYDCVCRFLRSAERKRELNANLSTLLSAPRKLWCDFKRLWMRTSS